jgi:hypothetical protein
MPAPPVAVVEDIAPGKLLLIVPAVSLAATLLMPVSGTLQMLPARLVLGGQSGPEHANATSEEVVER